MKHLYFCRHGESFVNINNAVATKLGAKNDLGLTENGIQQATKEGTRAASTGFMPDLIISSPLVRAVQTADIIAEHIGYSKDRIAYNELFIELQFGELEGTSWSEFWEKLGGYKSLNTFKDSETIETMQQRAEKALAYVNTLSEETILIVSHSAFGRALQRVTMGRPWTDEFENGASLPHGEIIKLI